MPYVTGGVSVTVPATSANLGPGYDALGLALALHDVVEVRPLPDGLRLEVSGEGADAVPRDERHLVVRAIRAGFADLGEDPPGLALTCTNRLPHGRGLGSSAAAIVAGLLATRGLVADGGRRLDEQRLLEVATRLEGHPDNVAPCLLGGATVAWVSGGRVRAARLEVHRGLVPVMCVPEVAVSTETARSLLPAVVPHADAAGNAARAALLVEALGRRPDLLLEATEDRLHQRYRRPAMPATLDLVDRLRSAGLAAVVSGAGPSVLVLTDAARADDVAGFVPPAWAVRRLAVDAAGASAEPLE